VLSRLNIDEGSVCIEIGCGQGAGAFLINQYIKCSRIVCVDLDPDMIDLAKRYASHPPRWVKNTRNNNIEFVCEDATQLSFPDCFFDAAFLFGVLNTVEEWQKVISEIFRTLKSGGIFSFKEAIIPDFSSHFQMIYRHLSIIKETELKDALEWSGFTIQHFEVTKYLPGCFVQALKN
jgi:ubiquinone/menaquinone biosynthesis C-methylase UbiE